MRNPFKRGLGDTPTQLVPPRLTTRNNVNVNADTALQHSAVWACLRLRANLVSTLPVDVFRKFQGIQMPQPTPPVLTRPGALFIGGTPVTVEEWLYATQFDLDRLGNCFGLIMSRDGNGFPSRIDLVDSTGVTVTQAGDGSIKYRIKSDLYTPTEVWHERQYVLAGLPVGLSPVAYAAMSIGQYTSAQSFALNWFGGSAVPAAHFKNTAKTLTSVESAELKARYNATVAAGDVLVTGSDWDYNMIGANASQSEFLTAQEFSIRDVARFFDVPGDLIDAGASGSSITYANLTQRNLEFLILHLGPTVERREAALSTLLPAPRYVKLNTGALLRMDPQTAAQVLALKVDKRVVTPDEWRQLDDMAPLTPEQITQFQTLFPMKGSQDTPAGSEP